MSNNTSKQKQSKSVFYTLPEVTSSYDENKKSKSPNKIDFKRTYEDEDLVAYLKSVKCCFSSIDLNEIDDEIYSIDIKGELILTKYKLEFIPNDSLLAKCFLPNYFNVNLLDFNFYQIPLSFIYGLYASDDRLKRIELGELLMLNEKKPCEIYVKCKNFLTKSFSFSNEENTSYEEFTKFFRILWDILRNTSYSIQLDSIKQINENNLNSKYYLKTTDFNQELEEYNCKSLFEVYSVQYSEPAIKSLVRKSEILKIPQVLPKNFLTQSNTDKVELFYDKRYPIWSFTYENNSSLILISSPFPNKVKEANEFLKIYNSSLSNLVSLDKTLQNGHDAYYKIDVPFNYIKLIGAYQKLNDICCYKHTLELYADDDNSWYSRLHDTKWFKYISRTFSCVNFIVDKITESQINVYLEEPTQNKDISCVVSSLVKICLYKKCRSINGFQELIQKEWFYVGHNFAKRLNIRIRNLNSDEASTQEESNNNSSQNGFHNNSFCPVFLFFLDCVHQLLLKFPDNFEFNELYLIHMYDYSLSGHSVTFSFNGALDWLRYCIETNSSNEYLLDSNFEWSKGECTKNIFINQKFFVTKRKFLKIPLRLDDQISALEFWKNCYLRWYDLNLNLNDNLKKIEENSRKISEEDQSRSPSPPKKQPIGPARPLTTINPSRLQVSSFVGNVDSIKNVEPAQEMTYLKFKVKTYFTPDGNIESSV